MFTRDFRGHIISLLKKKETLDIVFLLIISLISITWFRNFTYINNSDFGLPLDRVQYYDAAFYSWDPRYSTGHYIPNQHTTLLFGLSNMFSVILGMPLPVFERILFYFWFAFSGISAYILCYTVGGGRLARTTSALLYMMNPYSLFIVWQVGQGMIQASYAFFPLILGLYIHGVRNGKGFSYAVVMCFIWAAIGFLGPLANLHMTALYWIAIILCFLVSLAYFRLAGQTAKLKRCLKFTLGVIFAYFLLNLYWIAPVAIGAVPTLKTMETLQQFAWISQLDTLRMNSVNMVDAFRLSGYWAAMEEGFPGIPYFSFGKLYNTPLFLIISLIIPLLATLPILQKKLKLQTFYLYLILIIGIFLMVGTRSPLGGFGEYLFLNFLPLQMFRSGYVSVTMLTVIAMSPLCGIGLEKAYLNLKKMTWRKEKKIFGQRSSTFVARGLVIVILFLLFVVLAAPFWTGEVIQTYSDSSLNPRVEVPAYYSEFKEWLEMQQGDFRIGVLPLSKSTNTILSWDGGGYNGPEPLLWYSNRPVMYVNTLTPLYLDTLDSLDIGVSEGNSSGKILGLAGVKYLVVHEDANWKLIGYQPDSWFPRDENALKFLLRNNELQYVKTIGKLAIYQNPSYNEHIYGVSQVIDYQGDRKAIGAILDMNRFNLGNVTLVPNGILNFDEMDINPNYYIQNLNVTTDFNLEFNFNTTQRTDYVLTIRGDAQSALVDGKMVNLKGSVNITQPITVVPVEKVELWTQLAKDAQDRKQIDKSIITWVIDGNVAGDRGLVYYLNATVNLTNSAMVIPFLNVNATGTIRAALYDSSGNFAWWDFKLDWNEYKVLRLHEYNFDGKSDATNFDFSKIISLTLYYSVPKELSTNSKCLMYVSTLRISSSTQSQYPISSTEVFTLPIGAHTITLQQPSPDVSLLLQSKQDNNPKISFQRISPVEYQLKVTAEKPFILVFGETYNSGWELLNGKSDWTQIYFGQPLNASHFMVNGYANGWYIDQVGTYDLTIYFKPQSVYLPSLCLSTTFAIATMVYLWIKYRARH